MIEEAKWSAESPGRAPRARASQFRVKVCGATSIEDVEAAAAGGADVLGLWWQVRRTRRQVAPAHLVKLAYGAIERGLAPCLVTFSSSPADIARMVHASGCGIVQLHAFQTPDLVRRLRAALGPGVELWKALHVHQGTCLDLRFAASYVDAGTDQFVLDRVNGTQVGSTGQHIDPVVAGSIAGELTRPFMLAGGLTQELSLAQRQLVRHPLMAGIDIDSAARGPDRGFNGERISAVNQAWRAHLPNGRTR